jgi:CRP-like cAMP-binding protein
MKRDRAGKNSRTQPRPYTFFAHVAFAFSEDAHAAPQATANLLIEVTEKTVASSLKKRRMSPSRLKDSQKTELAGEIAMAAALKYLKSQAEFRQFPARRFVDFDAIRPSSYISVRPPPSKVFPDGTRISRMVESEADQLRGEPRSVRYPDIEQRLAAHPFLKGMNRHHIELLALCATPTDFDAGQMIFQEGDSANGLYLIETGNVALEGRRKDGKNVVVDNVGAGEPLGWSWLFPPYLWHFDARATKACTALCLSGILLRQHRDDDLSFSHELLKRTSEVMVRRLQAAREKLLPQK